MREAPKFAAAVAAVILAFGLAACGGGDSTTTTASTSNTTTSQPRPAKKDQAKGGSHNKAGKSNGSNGEGSAPSGGKVAAAPLKVSGGGSGQFRTKGGDNSIQEFGSEAGETELQQAAEAVHGFYVARAEEHWATACSYLTKSMAEQLEQLASQSPQFKGKGCAPILHAFTRPLSASVRRETTVVDAGSLRHKGEQSFLIYYGPGKTVYAMPMNQEDGKWKVGALTGDALG
jgi:hypothetical protein